MVKRRKKTGTHSRPTNRDAPNVIPDAVVASVVASVPQDPLVKLFTRLTTDKSLTAQMASLSDCRGALKPVLRLEGHGGLPIEQHVATLIRLALSAPDLARQAIGLLDVMVQCNVAAAQPAVASQVRAFFDVLPAAVSDDMQAYVQLQALLEFGLTRAAMESLTSQHVERLTLLSASTLGAFVDRLQALLSGTMAVGSIEVATATGACSRVLKPFLTVCQARSVQANLHELLHTQSAVLAAANELLVHTARLLRLAGLHRDLYTHASMTHCVLLFAQFTSGGPDLDAATHERLAHELARVYLGTTDAGAAEPLRAAPVGELSAVSELSVARALLCCSPVAVLQLPTSGSLFQHIATVVSHRATDAELATRLYAVQVLGLLLSVGKTAVAQQHVRLLSQDLLMRLVDLVLANWEHPSRKIASLMDNLFASLLDLQELSDTNAHNAHVALLDLLLSQRASSRTKYHALVQLLPRVRATQLLADRPTLVSNLLSAISSLDAVHAAASSLLFKLLSQAQAELLPSGGPAVRSGVPQKVRKEKSATAGGASGGAAVGAAEAAAASLTDEQERALNTCRGFWLVHVTAILVDSAPFARNRAATYLLPPVLELDRWCVGAMLAAVQGAGEEVDGADMCLADRRLWASLQLLKAARGAGLVDVEAFAVSVPWLPIPREVVERLHWEVDPATRALVPSGFTPVAGGARLAPEVMLRALSHGCMDIRLSALELVCISRSTAWMPTGDELEMLAALLVLTLKVNASQHRQAVTVMVGRMYSRMKEAAIASHKRVMYHIEKEQRALGLATTTTYCAGDERPADGADHAPLECADWRKLVAIDTFLTTHLEAFLGSLYPATPFQRACTALELLHATLQTWRLESLVGCPGVSPAVAEPPAGGQWCHPLATTVATISTRQTVLTLLNMLINSWDRVRVLAMQCLQLLPVPLPGIEDTAGVAQLLWWAINLCTSPRIRECDAGALIFKLVAQSYVRNLRWNVDFLSLPNSPVAAPAFELPAAEPEALFVASLLRVLEANNSAMAAGFRVTREGTGLCGNAYLSTGSSQQPPMVHGLLLSLRNVLSVVSLSAKARSADPAVVATWRLLTERMVAQVRAAFELSLKVVAENDDSGVADEPEGDGMPSIGKIDCRGHVILDGVDEEGHDAAQRIVVAAWLLVKESTLCLGNLVTDAPLPTTDAAHVALLSAETVTDVFHSIVHALLTVKHQGGITYVAAGLQRMCDKLMRTPRLVSALSALPRVCVEDVLARISAAEQAFILRRSSGVAQTILSVLRSEPTNTTPVLLPLAIERLLAMAAGDTTPAPSVTASAAKKLNASGVGTGAGAETCASQVHALNVLKLLFEDAALVLDLQPYAAKLLVIAVRGFNHTVWAVRNSSMMVFATVTARLVGSKRESDEDSLSHAATAGQLFGRYPSLHKFLLEQLVAATATVSGHQDALHPALYPVLLLLSRLRPAVTEFSEGVISDELKVEEVDDDTDDGNESDGSHDDGDAAPARRSLSVLAFVPPLQECSRARHHMARVMAARALVSLVPLDSLPGVFESVLQQVPGAGPIASHNVVHGLLLQVLYILRSMDNAANAAGVSVGSMDTTPITLALLRLASVHLPAKAWLATDAMACPPVRQVAVQVLLRWRRLAVSQGVDATDVLALLRGCSNPAGLAPSAAAGTGPCVSRLAEAAYVAAWEQPAEQFSAVFGALMGNVVEDVRVKAAKLLYQSAVKVGGSHSHVVAVLPLVWTLVPSEGHPAAVDFLLRTAALYCEKNPSFSIPSELWKWLQTAFHKYAKSTIQSSILMLLSASVRKAVDEAAHSGDWGGVAEQVTQWEAVLASSAANVHAIDLRGYAAEGIRLSSVLHQRVPDAHESVVCVVVRVWATILELVQDEDEEVREAAAACVAAASGDGSLSEGGALVAGFMTANKLYGHSKVWLRYLCSQLTLHSDGLLAALSKHAAPSGASALSRKVFETEQDNIYIERSLMIGLTAWRLMAIGPSHSADAQFRAWGESIVARFSEAIVALRNVVAAAHGGQGWLGGPTFQADVFFPMSVICSAMTGACAAFPDLQLSTIDAIHALAAFVEGDLPIHDEIRQGLQLVYIACSSGAELGMELSKDDVGLWCIVP